MNSLEIPVQRQRRRRRTPQPEPPMEQTLLAQLQLLYRLQQNHFPRILDRGICNADGFLPQGPDNYKPEGVKHYHRRFLLFFYRKAGEVLGYPCGPTSQKGKYPDQMEFLFPLDSNGDYVHPCTEDRFWKDDPYIHPETKQTARHYFRWERKSLRSARLKLIQDIIRLLESPLCPSSKESYETHPF